MAEIKLIKVTYQQSRLDFFKKQLDKATRSMNYHVKRKHHPDICAEYGEIASFYEWAVDKAKEPGWIPVSERLPEELKNVLAYTDVGSFAETAHWTGYRWEKTWDFEVLYGVTHWMPLPEPPKEEDK